MRSMEIEQLVHKPNAELLYEWFKNHGPDEASIKPSKIPETGVIVKEKGL